MKNLFAVVGIILILFGIVTLAYKGFTYTKHEQVAQIGDLRVDAETTKTVYITPLVSVLCLGAGVFLVLVARRGGGIS